MVTGLWRVSGCRPPERLHLVYAALFGVLVTCLVLRYRRPTDDLQTYSHRLAQLSLGYFFQAGGADTGDAFLAKVTRRLLPQFRSPCWVENANMPRSPYRNRFWTHLYPGRGDLREHVVALQAELDLMTSHNRSVPWVRCLPAFYLGGVYKAGTTDLYEALSRHPLLFPGMLKEPLWQLWKTGKMAPVDFRDYIGLFDLAALRINRTGKWMNSYTGSDDMTPRLGLTFDGTSGLFHMYRYWEQLPWNRGSETPLFFIADHIKVINPRAKFIFLFRDPASWLVSCYNFFQHNYVADVNSGFLDSRIRADIQEFDACMGGEEGDASLVTCVYRHNGDNCSALNVLYYSHALHWVATFPKHQLLFLRSEDYYRDRGPALTDIYRFLGVPEPGVAAQRAVAEMTVHNAHRHRAEMWGSTREAVRLFMHPWNIKLCALLGSNSFCSWNIP